MVVSRSLEAAAGIGSDHYLAEVLLAAKRKGLNEQQQALWKKMAEKLGLKPIFLGGFDEGSWRRGGDSDARPCSTCSSRSRLRSRAVSWSSCFNRSMEMLPTPWPESCV